MQQAVLLDVLDERHLVPVAVVAVVDAVVDNLKRLGYLNDEQFARDRAAEQATHYIAAAFIGRDHTIHDQESTGTYVVGYHAQGGVRGIADTGDVRGMGRCVVVASHDLGEGLIEAMSLAFAILGDPRARVQDAVVLWADPETRTEAAHADATVKLYESGILPWQITMERLGFGPTEIARARQMKQREALELGFGADLDEDDAPLPGLPEREPPAEYRPQSRCGML